MPTNLKMLRLPAVMEMSGLCRSQLYALVKCGEFPSPIKLSERSSAWICSEVETWIEQRISMSRVAQVKVP